MDKEIIITRDIKTLSQLLVDYYLSVDLIDR